MKGKKYDMMSTDEVADLFAVSKRTVIRWVDGLGLPAFKLGGVLRFDRKEVVAWAEQFHSQGDQVNGDGQEGVQP